MNQNAFSSPKATPREGKDYLKILGSGEIVKQRSFSEITQLYEVETVDGKVFTVQSNRVSKLVAPEEAAEFASRAAEEK